MAWRGVQHGHGGHALWLSGCAHGIVAAVSGQSGTAEWAANRLFEKLVAMAEASTAIGLGLRPGSAVADVLPACERYRGWDPAMGPGAHSIVADLALRWAWAGCPTSSCAAFDRAARRDGVHLDVAGASMMTTVIRSNNPRRRRI